MKTSYTLAATFFGVASAICSPTFGAKKPAPAAATTTATTQDREASYTEAIEKRTQDILAALDLKDPAKTAAAHDAIVAHYRHLRDWHDTHDARLKELTRQSGADGAAAEIDAIKASMKSLHDQYLAALSSPLTAEQVEQVKDKMTYNKVRVTYDGYVEIVPDLTNAEKVRIVELLKEAREEALDGGSAEEKSAIFKKYKGKINNYLSGNGHDVAKAYKDWGERQKLKAATKPAAPVARVPD